MSSALRRLSRFATSMDLEVKWGARFRRPLLVWVYVQHLMTFVYFGLLGAMHLTLDLGMRVAMRSYASGPSGALLVLTGVLHCWPFLPLRVQQRCARACARQGHRTHSRWWPKSLVPSTNVQIALGHFVAISCETYTAYDMSCRIVNPHLAGLYASLLVLNCVCTTWLLFLRDASSKLVWVNLLDSAISFALSAGFPLFFLLLPLIRFVFVSSRDIAHSLHWYAQIYSTSRTLCVSSLPVLALRVVPGVTNFGVLRRVSASLRYKRHHALGPPRGTIPTGWRAFTLQQRHGRLLKIVLACNVLWGVAVAVTSVRALYLRSPCPDYCVYASAPWFTTECNCIYALLNCRDAGIEANDSVDNRFHASIVGPNLVFLHLQRCAVPNGLALETLSQFQSLYALKLEMTQLARWDVPGTSLPSSVMLIDVRYSQLASVPYILRSMPPSVRWLFLVGHPKLVDIPSDVYANWTNLLSLWLGDNALPHVRPRDIAQMTSLQILDLSSNQIADIPETELGALPLLRTLYLHNNAIRIFPSTLLRAKPNLLLSLNHNPIATIAEIVGRSVHVASTPFCTATPMTSACYEDCAPSCGMPFVGNYLCDLGCNTTACAFDGGDCDF
ncbi:hypothetical protein SDRG_14614 [Saprolegnia diclina VS20]|uniref:LNR domain-containing protein n=1 Tax=Saprolegnia diclina (strain VS20) TaxID=1156394 RepID=T0R657_SAPDV|nr:hypothetical protein SDRG_14614 [Saprolegnia diclina VS20]EQC27558.1 hypothetical protein SDRG_14614 [Saprolegnia diclina VS20]|eukprot:XP_008618978.1 hypothetical protein SDRG_14614 [Saprolegnia diclina VS20]